MSHRGIVVAISAALQHQHFDGGMRAEDVAAEILGRQEAMPDYLRAPMWVATLLFDAAGIFSGGRRFQEKDGPARANQLRKWKHSSLGACRNFVRFYESLFFLIVLQEDRR